MPYSSESGKQFTAELLQELCPVSVLDVGAGAGTYARFRQPEQRWTAIEIWQPSIAQFALEQKYDHVICGDARVVPIAKHDVIILGDVLEHMDVRDAQALVTRCRQAAKYVIVSIPIGHYPQGAFDGNPYEEHVTDDWSVEEVREAFGAPWREHLDKEIGVFVYRQLKICVYAISKNEAQFVERFCASAAQADLVLIADTGSTDDTAERARSCGAQVFDIRVQPWRFDMARDTAMCLIPADVDVCVSLDLDEVLEPGWRQEIERVWQPGTTRLRYKFDWGHNICFYYEKIHARSGYRWHHPVHEYPRADKRIVEKYAHTDLQLVTHLPDPTKSRGQYLNLLRMSVQEDPVCPRNAFYFARELTFYQLWDDAITALQTYLALPGADWENERCYAMRLLGKSFDELGNGAEALRWYRRATAEAPGTREPWVDLAMSCYLKKLWPECLFAAEQALRIKDKEFVYTCDPEVWGYKPHDLAALAAHHLGQNDAALVHGKQAVQLATDEQRQRLEQNVFFYHEATHGPEHRHAA